MQPKKTTISDLSDLSLMQIPDNFGREAWTLTNVDLFEEAFLDSHKLTRQKKHNKVIIHSRKKPYKFLEQKYYTIN